MKRAERYCDVCGKQMTYQDSDDNTTVQGLTMETPVVVDIHIKEYAGSSTVRVGAGHQDFCSIECFETTLTTLVARAAMRCTNMRPLD